MRQAEKTGDAWLPQDPTPYPAATEPGVHFQINMMSAPAPTVKTDIASDDEDDAELPLIDAFDASRINNPLSNNRSMSELTSGLVEIEKVLSAYTDTLREPFGSTHHHHALKWVYRVRYQGGTIHQPYPNAPAQLGAAARHHPDFVTPPSGHQERRTPSHASPLQHRQMVSQCHYSYAYLSEANHHIPD
jgi:hypothetical protein